VDGIKNVLAMVIMLAGAGIWNSMAAGQQKTEKPVSSAHLEVMVEVAATTEDGYPSVLRVTVKNVGDVAVDMPMPVVGCKPHGGHIAIHVNWKPSDETVGKGRGWGEGCGESEGPSLKERIRDEWIHLKPDEFIVISDNFRLRLGQIDPGTIEY
jgi:hypothetical protein